MAIHQNTFLGLNKDLAYSKYPNNKCLNIENFRILTEEGASTGALVNLDGNAMINTAFPAINGFMSIEATVAASDDSTVQKTLWLEFFTDNNNIKISPAVEIHFYTADDLFDQIETELNNINISYKRLSSYPRIVVYGDNYNLLFTYASITTTYITTTIYDAASNFIIIGDTTLRDNIILFTVNDTGTTRYSQLWNMTYEINNPKETVVLDLLYHGNLNFNRNNRISADGRYENTQTQRVYWNDYLNSPRNANIVAEDLLAYRTVDFLSSPQIELHPAYVTTEEQTGGNLPTGLWYITYKLFKSGGGDTPSAPITLPTPVFSDEVTGNEISGVETDYEFINYTTIEEKSTKILNYHIPKVPSGYEKINIYAVHEATPGLYKAYLYKTDYLTDSEDYDFSLSDVDDLTEVPIEDLFDYTIDFDKVKTQAIKDNLLLYANIVQSVFNIDFDTRAYRFKPLSSDSYIGNISIPTLSIPNWGIDEIADAYNPFNKDTDAGFNSTTGTIDNDYRYRRGSNQLGGTGPNISYEFTFEPIQLDDSEAVPLKSGDAGTVRNPSLTPFVNQAVRQSLIKTIKNGDETTLETGPGFNNYKNNKIETYFKGFMRDEVYRFGIVFYSKTGRMSEVKWIADIRMPSAGDFSTNINFEWEGSLAQYYVRSENGYATQNGAYIPVDTATQKSGTFGNILGVKFYVDVSSIADQISGYSIVRAPRREKDRTIIAEGVLGELFKRPNYNIYYNYTRINDTYNTSANAPGIPIYNYCTIDCPDLKIPSGAKVSEYATTPSIPYKIKPVAAYTHLTITDTAGEEAATATGGSATGVSIAPYDRYAKAVILSHAVNSNNRFLAVQYGEVKELKNIDTGNNVLLSDSTNYFYNQGYIDMVGNSTTGLTSEGVHTILIKGIYADMVKYIINIAYNKITSSEFNKHPFSTLYASGIDYDYNNNNNCGAFSYLESDPLGKVNRVGQVVIVDIYRELENQYDGSSYLQRQNTEYISTGNYISISSGATTTTRVFGGDVYLGLFAEKKLKQNTGIVAMDSPVIGKIVPIQTIVNTELRNGYNFNNYASTSTGTALTATQIDARRIITDEYTIPQVYHKEKELQTYTTEGTNSLISEYDNRIYVSEKKSNGETADSWTIFKPFNYLDVDGHYGPINKITVLNDRLLFFQDKGFGIIGLNPKTTISDIDGGEVQLGTGQGLVDYTYISTSVGCRHQWGVLNAKNSIYFWDANLRKMFRYTGQGNEPLSDLKGMSAFFYNTLKGTILTTDTPLVFNGVLCTYDHRYNDAIFTFHTIKDKGVPESYTLVYNERMPEGGEFTGFYPYAPRHYVNDNKKIFTQNYKWVYLNDHVTSSIQGYDIYVHDEGEKGTFYGQVTEFPSRLSFVINPKGHWNKVFNNMEFLSQVTTSAGVDIPLETITSIRFYNEWQDSGIITLTPQVNLRRRLRTWRLGVPRDMSSGISSGRIRNQYCLCDIEYTNSNDKKIILNDITTYYVDSSV